jgi:hypothetical protein
MQYSSQVLECSPLRRRPIKTRFVGSRTTGEPRCAYWKFNHLTVDQVYRPLAKSSGKILELTQAQSDNSKTRYKKLHEFLSDIGVKALRTQLGQLLGIARISRSQNEYEGHFQTLFGEQRGLFGNDATLLNH